MRKTITTITNALPPAELSRISTNQSTNGKLSNHVSFVQPMKWDGSYSDSIYFSQSPAQKAMTRAPMTDVIPLKIIEYTIARCVTDVIRGQKLSVDVELTGALFGASLISSAICRMPSVPYSA